MLRKKLFFLCTLLLAVMLVLPLHAVELKPAGPDDVASGAARDINVWCPGGIGGHWLAVGQPNLCNRNDKVMFRFPLASFIAKGSVRKAVLKFNVTTDKRNVSPENLVLEHFTTDRRELTAQALLSTEVEDISNLASMNAGANQNVVIDVTEFVNKDLAKGYVYVNFRVTSKTAEKLGAPKNGIVNCASITKSSIVLDVTP